MSNDYRNCEGYPDPTAGEALSRIAANEKQSLRAFRPIVYICSPFSGDVETNVANARRYSRYAVDKGYIPIAPHLLFPQFLDDDNPDERELGLFFGNALMSKCAEVWVFGSRISSGMEADNKQDYDAIADEIFRLRDQKEQSELDIHHREEAVNRIKELQDFIAGQEPDITEFDEALVKKLIEKITVFADHFTVEFKSGITIDIEA